MKSNLRHVRAAFTLIELMAVITITVILASIVVGGMGFVKERQAKETAKVQIAQLSKAIEDYKTDMGKYPGMADDTPLDGDVSEELYQELFKDGYDYTRPTTPPADWTKATKIYLPELDPLATKQDWVQKSNASEPPADLKITDPWGENYRYRKGSNAENPDFDLWSAGKDKKTDVSNPAVTATDNKDDIRNF